MNFPGRRSLAITSGIATVLMFIGLLFTNAHKAPLDDLGCHQDPPQSKYHCHTGALKGKEFASREDAERAIAAVRASDDEKDFAVSGYDEPPAKEKASRGPASSVGDKLNLPPPPAPPTAVVNENLLKIVSWKVRKREKMDVDRIANVLAEVDIAVLHDLDLDEVGKGPLHRMGDLLQARIGEKICRMWFRNTSGGKEKIGILWRNSTVSHVESGGAVKSNCGEMAVIVPTSFKKGERGLATSLFFSKVQKKIFMLAAADFDGKPGKLTPYFKNLDSTTWPTIVVGDLRATTSASKDLNKSLGFKAAINGKRPRKRSSENFYTRNATATRALPINLYERFSEISPKEIDTSVSDSFPILAELELVADTSESAPSISVAPEKKTSKKPKEKASAPKQKVVSEARTEVFDDPSEDLEAEANHADPEATEKRAPASKKPSSKKKSKKKSR